MNSITSANQQLGILYNENRDLENKMIKVAEITKPFPPRKPDIYFIKKPVYFEGTNFLRYFIILIIPAIVISYWIFNDNILQYGVLIGIIISLLGLALNYSIEYEEYKKRVNEKNQKLLRHENELNLFHKNIQAYEIQMEKNNKIHLQNKELYNKRNQIEDQIVETLIYLYLNEEESKKMMLWLQLSFSYEYHPIFIKFKTSQQNLVTNKPQREMNANVTTNQLKNLDPQKQQKFIELLKQVQRIQQSMLSNSEKASKIKEILWTNQSTSGKLWIGAILGSLTGLAIFGTGGIGIAGLGGAVGIWGFLTGTAGGILVSSVIQNYEKRN